MVLQFYARSPVAASCLAALLMHRRLRGMMEEMPPHRPTLPPATLDAFCRRNHIRRLSSFGSVLRDDFRPDSDIDVFVEFEPEHVPGFLRLAAIEIELSRLLDGRKVDLRTPEDLSRYFRDAVVAEAEVQYAAG
jgi:predicted nucleotidyltransferase